ARDRLVTSPVQAICSTPRSFRSVTIASNTLGWWCRPRRRRRFIPPVHRLLAKSRRRAPSSDRRWRSVRCASRTTIGYNTGVAMSSLRGRVVEVSGRTAVLLSDEGRREVETAGADVRVGDWIVVADGRVDVVGRSRRADPGGAERRVLDPRRLRAMDALAATEDGIRAFFRERGFREVHTP